MQPIATKFLSFCLLTIFSLAAGLQAQKPAQLSGYVEPITYDCLNPEYHDHAPHYYLEDETTGERVRLNGYDKQLGGIHPRQKVRIKGLRKSKENLPKGKATQTGTAGSGADLEIEQLELLPLTKEEAAKADAPVANGANTLTMLSTLLVFISTDTHGCMTIESNARGRLFDNPTNANEGMQAITKGRYGLQLGNGTGDPEDHIIHLHLPVNSANYNSSSIKDLALDKLFNDPVSSGGMGLTRIAWNRILYFAPDGIKDSGFSAYAAFPNGDYTTHGLTSVYGRSYGNNRLNGYLHELGHNFGFAHSAQGRNEYGDRTCVMGVSNNSTLTETYNVTKLLATDWLDAFPNAKRSVSKDTTIDLYPLSSDPNVVNQTIAINFPGTGYYAAYHRDERPYGFLARSGDRDKVFVYTSGINGSNISLQVANLSEGSSYSGPSTITFEHYGPNMEYATVSFDVDDGNAKPMANAQFLNAIINSDLGIKLTGSDADPSDTLSYTLVTIPSHGSLSGTPPNLTYTPSTDYLGTDSFVFKVDDGQISSYATISISVIVENTPPEADDQSVNVFKETPEPVTLTATDADGHLLNYSVVSGPSDGVLTGTPPNLTYTPDDTFSGTDSFIFEARDSHGGSDTATVSITVSTSPNTPPVVEAGPNQTLYLPSAPDVPGLYYGTASGDINLSTPNPQTQILVDPSTQTENSIAENTTEIYSGYIYDADGQISFTERIDDKTRVWIDGVLVLSDDYWVSRISTLNLNLDPGWHKIEIRLSNGIGGSGPVDSELGIGYDPAGGTNWQALTDPGDASFLRVNESRLPQTTLHSSSVTDPEHAPTYVWTDTGKGTGSGTVTFSDVQALNPTVTFTSSGTYVLRLSANDGYSERSDEVTITVNPPLPAAYETWAGGTFDGTFSNLDPTANIDGDASSNMMEFAFGTDPTDSDSGPLAINGSASGQPVIVKGAGGVMEFYFVRRKDHGSSGSVSYTVEFSSNLGSFTKTPDEPKPVADYALDPRNYQMVKVDYPAESRFARIEVKFVE